MTNLLGNLKNYSHPHIFSISSSRYFFSSYSTLTVIYIQDFNYCSNEVVSSILVSDIKRHILDNSQIKDLVFERVIRRKRQLLFRYDHSARYLRKKKGYLKV